MHVIDARRAPPQDVADHTRPLGPRMQGLRARSRSASANRERFAAADDIAIWGCMRHRSRYDLSFCVHVPTAGAVGAAAGLSCAGGDAVARAPQVSQASGSRRGWRHGGGRRRFGWRRLRREPRAGLRAQPSASRVPVSGQEARRRASAAELPPRASALVRTAGVAAAGAGVIIGERRIVLDHARPEHRLIDALVAGRAIHLRAVAHRPRAAPRGTRSATGRGSARSGRVPCGCRTMPSRAAACSDPIRRSSACYGRRCS